ncbi:MAG: nucleotidyltransferase family protein [Firmicutes bacterium]|nr:nucleotidyltransferase family protein [Bacillota bacterium]
MTAEEYRNALKTVAYLAACAVNGTVPERERTAGTDPDVLIRAAERHKLAGITAQALESAGIRTEATVQAKGNAIRKVILLDAEKNAILERFEAAGIWYMPLKGAILKDLYPALGMREMSDIDILIDPERMEDADGIMREMGYEDEGDNGAHCGYHKEPVYNIELHYLLFQPEHVDAKVSDYYADVRDRLIPDEGSRFGFHFSDEDFYIYILAHEYKHYYLGGTGLRSLLDTYIYIKEKGGSLDWDYVAGELEKIGMSEFEEKNRSLALHLFNGENLSEEEQERLDYIVFSGTYGTMKNKVDNAVVRQGGGFLGKLRYFFRRLFLPMDKVRKYFPLFAKVPILLPFLPIYRLIRSMKENKGRTKTEIKALFRHRKKKGTDETGNAKDEA